MNAMIANTAACVPGAEKGVRLMIRQDLINFCLTFPATYEDYPFEGGAAAGVKR